MPVQMSNAQATRNGIQALEMAKAGVERARGDVLETGGALSSGYQGGDGAQFGNLLRLWDDQCMVILNGLQAVINELTRTGQEHGVTQLGNQDAISQAQTGSQAAFDQLHA
ncbi:hypothetical protein [Streptomyces xantholiticus]|uniref:hypothetical protein n=1 Tax=Streptomyces xantholiticus TaxID=68285 RepID=UPI00167B1D70|nr:hypothetical protein [Streptomyces xantholiticus]GGW30754.1 hypothetical protein GCM10010381_14060 [Streptomyces xantholiticus]